MTPFLKFKLHVLPPILPPIAVCRPGRPLHLSPQVYVNKFEYLGILFYVRIRRPHFEDN